MNNSIKDHLPPCFCGLQNKLPQPTDFGLSHRKIEEDSNDKVFVVPVLMSLSKAFDTLNHEFLFADLYAFGFNRSPVKLTNDYLSFKQTPGTLIKGNTVFNWIQNCIFRYFWYCIFIFLRSNYNLLRQVRWFVT